MELKVKDVAKILRLSEKTIYRMIQSETIPFLKVGGQWRFKKDEILAWFEDAKDVAPAMNQPGIASVMSEGKIVLPELLQRGGIYYRIEGNSKEGVIRESLTQLKAGTPQCLVDKLIRATLERERLCPTAIGHGVALPHPRTSKGLTDPVPYIALFFLERPLPFGAMDGEDVRFLFFISPGNRVRNLRLQAKLLAALRSQEILEKLRKVPSRQEVYELFSDGMRL